MSFATNVPGAHSALITQLHPSMEHQLPVSPFPLLLDSSPSPNCDMAGPTLSNCIFVLGLSTSFTVPKPPWGKHEVQSTLV